MKNKEKSKKKKINNPLGKGGFKERPQDINTTGQNSGSISIKTKIKRAIDFLAKKTGKTPEEVEDNLFIIGYDRAQKGEYAFWQAIMEYIHGALGSQENPIHMIDLGEEAKKRLKKYQ